jgi:hypothetical protein
VRSPFSEFRPYAITRRFCQYPEKSTLGFRIIA